MSGTGEATADFAGEERSFRIRLGEIRRIEAKCGGDRPVGIGEVCRRLAKASFVMAKCRNPDGSLDLGLALANGIEIFADDVRAPIYEGLVGAGMATGAATAMVRMEIDDRGVRGLLENAPCALMVLVGSQETPKGDDPPGESKAGPVAETPPSPPTSPTSTASARPSA